MSRHALVRWFLDGWRQAVGVAQERAIFDRPEAKRKAAAQPDGCIEMQLAMLCLERVAGAPI
jgi:hypothetical protein